MTLPLTHPKQTSFLFETADDIFYTFPILDNKADTLMQSQMLKASASAAFIASQPKEILGLQKLRVFDIKHIAERPPDACLISSIWSYHQKQIPWVTYLNINHDSALMVRNRNLVGIIGKYMLPL
jgi:hypothetical protein